MATQIVFVIDDTDTLTENIITATMADAAGAPAKKPATPLPRHDHRTHQGPEGAWLFLPQGHPLVHCGQQQGR